MYKKFFCGLLSLATLLPFSIDTAYGWHAKTHRYIASKLVGFLPEQEQGFFREYQTDFLAGVQAADSNRGNMRHHITFDIDGEVKSDIGAVFAEELGEEAVEIIHEARRRGGITEEDKSRFAELCGYIVHVITDMNAFHVIWGEDQYIHNRYESCVDDSIMVGENGELESVAFEIGFDGTLRECIDPYEAVMEVAKFSYSGTKSVLPAEDVEREMSEEVRAGNSYVGDWDPRLKRTTKRIISKGANTAAEAVDEIFQRAFEDPLDPEEPIIQMKSD